MDPEGVREDKRGGGSGAQKARVKVAIRVRPFIEKEKHENGCIEFRSDTELVIGGDRSYKFDRVFREDSPQAAVYEQCIRELVLNCFDGYNAAVLAYGQTGSGKTFTMGTAACNFGDLSSIGIIPRTVYEIFREVGERRERSSVEVRASFIEIYNEQIIDLLADPALKDPKHQNPIAIREEKDGSVTLSGVSDEPVVDAEQMFKLLQMGGRNRTTASTLMNDASSRSHAIFTMTIKQGILVGKGKEQEEGTITAKFFFVDLAGSERAKKTGATGAVLKEGININLGLLQLGNVISALSTIDRNREQFITYRNSKLTRILQDCLGGNSNTYMIACVSPAESNYEQSLNTLKYASKAMNIKNTPIVNRDEKTQLRQRILELEEDNRRLRNMLAEKGVRLEDLEPPAHSPANDELKKLREELRQFTRRLADTSTELQAKSHKLNELEIKAYETRREKEVLQLTIEELLKEHPHLANSEASLALKQRLEETEKDLPVLEKYMAQVQALEQRLADRDCLFAELQTEYNKLLEYSRKEETLLLRKTTQLQQVAKDNQRLREELKRVQQGEGVIQEANVVGEGEEEAVLEAEAASDAVIQQGEKHYIAQEQLVRQQMQAVERRIEERQQFLQKMSRENVQLGSELVSSLNQNYHEKIVTLQRERKGLLKQKQEVSAGEKAKLASKIQSLEGELRDYRKKDKEQRKKERLMETQSTQIRELAEEIKKFKVQKAALDRKVKEERTEFDKLKSRRLKQLMVAKKESLKKDGIIRKLTIDNFKNLQFTRKKEEEIRKVKRLNDALKTIVRPKRTPQFHHRPSLAQSATLQPPGEEAALEQEQVQVVQRIKQQILLEIDRETALQKYQRSINDNTQHLEVLYADDAAYRIQLQRLQLQEEQRELTEEEAASREELAMRVDELKERISSCADGLKYSQAHYSAIMGSVFEPFDMEAQILFNPAYSSLPSLRMLVRALIISLKNLLFENNLLLSRNGEAQAEGKALREEVVGLREQIMALNAEYCRNLAQAREELMMNRLQEQELPAPHAYKRLEEKQRRELERRIQDLSRTNRQITAELEKNRRKCEVVQQKYQNIKNLVSKDRNIGTQQLPSFSKPKTTDKNNKALLEELDGMLDNIDRLKKVKSSTNLEEYADKSEPERSFQGESRGENRGEMGNKWECVSKIDAHNSSVLSVALHESLLVSSATKNIRVWDLENRKLISDLTGPQLAGSVKYVLIDPIRGLFLSACERAVTIWDLVTLQVQATLRCHKDEVRTIHVHGDYIFTGGKGTANGGSLLVWDLRKLNPNQALQEKEKNQDIFTFASNDNILYYGTRNHSIRRINTNNFDVLSPFEPPHLDSVTGLAISRGRLISGSKDKHLRLWALDHSINNSKHTLHVFNDYVSALHSPPAHPLIYTGSKDGQVKVCYTKNDKIQVLSGILTHTQSVNALTTLYQNPYGLVTASQDKTIKLWQPTKETLENIARENYF